MEHISDLAKGLYNLQPDAVKKLDGFESENYLLSAGSKKWVLKIYPFSQEKMKLLEAENNMLDHVNSYGPGAFPGLVKNVMDRGLTLSPDHRQIIRVLSYIDGEVWANVEPSPGLHRSLGAFLGRLSRILQHFNDDGIRAREIHWDLAHSLENRGLLQNIKDQEIRRLVHYFLLQYEEHVLPVRYQLRMAYIHNDANDWNVVVKDKEVIGLIDFGDAAYSFQISEVAVACAYAAMGHKNPLKVCVDVLSAYHSEFPLEPIEVDVLYHLIAARLCHSLCASWTKKAMGEDTEYAIVSEVGATSLLQQWLSINPWKARHDFQNSIGLSPGIFEAYPNPTERRKKLLSSALSISYKRPIHMLGAALQYMYDREGNTYLDAYNNIMLTGHCHPWVVEAGQRMLARLNTNTRYHYDILYDYGEQLLSMFPAGLNRVFFVNSGSAATDLAIRVAREYTGRKKVAVVQHGYHGNTQLGIDISHYKYNHKGGHGKKDFVVELDLPDTFRGKYRNTDGAGVNYAAEARELLKLHGRDLAAFIAEPIVGCGGQIPLAPGFLKALYPIVRSHGGVCISDEVQVGFGRLGHVFWGFEMHGVVPDIVVLGKPMGNGHPIGAVVTTAEIADGFANGMEFFSSFGGNPVSCAIGKAVLDVLAEEGLQTHARVVGGYLKDSLVRLAREHPSIGDVRGSGLFLGVDLIREGNGLEPGTALAGYLKNGLRDRHILLSTDGPGDNVLKIKPPLCFTRQNVDILIENMDHLLQNKSYEEKHQ